MKQVINRRSVIINTVIGHLNFLLSMFNINEVSVPSSSMYAAISDNIT